jgi:uncharacterized membrane protein
LSVPGCGHLRVMKRFRLAHSLRTSLWLVPVLCVLVGVAISFVTMAVDDGHLVPQSVTGGPDAALMILGSVATSMVTLIGLVLTIVLVVVQLAMGQFSPRIVRAILRDRPSQLAIGIFVATFAHSMLAMRRVASTEPGDPVPGLAIVVAFVLVVLSIMVLIGYVHHIGQSLRVAALIESVGQETRELMDSLYEDHGTDPTANEPDVVAARQPGTLFRVDCADLVRLARQADCTLVMEPAVGDFVVAGAPLFRVAGDASRLSHEEVCRAVALGPERTMNQDMAYGFRMLVDTPSDRWPTPTKIQRPRWLPLTASTTCFVGWCDDRFLPVATTTKTAPCAWSCPRCPGTATWPSPSTSFAMSVCARPRCPDGCGRRSRTS